MRGLPNWDTAMLVTGFVVVMFGCGLWLGQNFTLPFSCYTILGAGLFLFVISFFEPPVPALCVTGLVCLAAGILFLHGPVVLRDLLAGIASGALSGAYIRKKLPRADSYLVTPCQFASRL